MKQRLNFNIKIPWTQNSTKMLFLFGIILVKICEYTVSLQQISTNEKHVNNKRSVNDLTTAVIQKDSISDDAYDKLASNCPSLDRKIYQGHTTTGLLTVGAKPNPKFSYEKIPSSKATSLDQCLDECCNSNNYCESIFVLYNSSGLTCFMITCHEGKLCLPAKSTKNMENSTAVVLLRPPNGVRIWAIYRLSIHNFIKLHQTYLQEHILI